MNCANHPDRERTAFCQNCGKPLCAECVRTVGASIFCEPCYIARTTGQPGYPPGGSGSAAPTPYPVTPGEPSPGLAALLGFIPGVGAMYNGQYAKGIVHLLVFVILVSLAHDVPVFGILIPGWIVYQVIEAHHTARARRDGTPLPNPFGLNDISERLGFNRGWPGGAPTSAPFTSTPFTPAPGPAAWSGPSSDPNAPGAAASGPGSPNPDPPHTHPPFTNVPYSAVPPPNPYTYNYVPPVSHWGAPQDAYNYAVPPIPPVPPVPPMPPYPELDPNFPYPRRFPTGAIWLIGMGVFFLLANTGLFHLRARYFGPLLLIAIGVWIFVRRMTFAGGGVANDGSPSYPIRLALALRGSGWAMLIGIIWLLGSLHILTWGMSWPILLIAFGVMLFLRRSLLDSYGYPPYSGYPYGAPPAPPAASAAAATSTELVPTRDHSTGKEGQ